MSTESMPGGFSFHNLITRVVPGAVIVAPLITGAYFIYPEFFQETSVILILAGLASLLVGEIIEVVRAGLFRVPPPFGYFVFMSTEDPRKLSLIHYLEYRIREKTPFISNRFQKTPEEGYPHQRLDIDFRDDMEAKFGIDFTTTRTRDIYDMMLLHLAPTLSTRTQRFQSLFMFTTNLKIATVFALLFYLIQLFYSP